LEVLRERVELPELKRICITAWDRDKPYRVLIEDAASGQSLIQELKRETRLPIIPVRPDSDKVIRAFSVTPLIEAGKVFLPEYAPWLHDYIEELSAFPNGQFDDMVDSTTQALRQVANPSPYGFSISGEE
jgi:predicted phage terminase large subunit-like protein